MKARTNTCRVSSNIRQFCWLLLWSWLTCFLLCAGVQAQNVQYTNKAVDIGLKSTLRVNPTTRGVEFQIPLGHYRGRGGLDVPVTLSYSSKVWGIEFVGFNPGAPPPHQPQSFTIVVAKYGDHSVAGWTTSMGFPEVDATPQNVIYDAFGNATFNCTGGCYKVDRIMIWMPDGSGHELRASDQPRPTTQAEPDEYYAVDGSRMRYQKSTGTLYLPDGSRYLTTAGKYIDRNGNTLTASGGWRDTLDRQINTPLPYAPGSAVQAPTDQNYSLPGVGGTSINYVLKWRNLADVLTTAQPLRYTADGGCPPGTGSFSPYLFASDGGSRTCIINAGSIFNPVVLSQIVLPNGQSYTFTYDVYGAIDKVVLPNGGYEKYAYSYVVPISSPANFKLVYAQGNRGATSRIISTTGSSTDEVQWAYAGGGNSVIMTAPDGSRTESYLHTDGVLGWGYSADSARAGRPFEQRIYSSTGQMLRRKLTEWAITPSNATGNLSGTQIANRNARIAREVDFLLDTTGPALAKARTYGYDNTYQYSVGLDQTSVNEFDYVEVDQNTAQTASIASIPNGTLLRATETDYLTSDANYRALNLVGLPTAARVKNAAGSVVAQSSWTYDEPAYPLLANTGVLGWTDPSTGFRGNVTTMSRWLNFNGTTISAFPLGTYLATHMQYDQCGSVRNIWDAKDTSQTNPRQIEYSNAFQYAYPTKRTSEDPDGGGPLPSLVTTEEYDFSTGLTTATVDENLQRTTSSYNDPLNRMTQIIRAATDATAKNQTTYQYDDSAHTVTVTSDLYAYNDNLLKTVSFHDGVGRLKETRQYEGPSSYISTQQEYDNFGRVFRTSNPLRPSETLFWTTRTFDNLGRILTITTPDNAVITKSYSGNSVTVTDQSGIKIKTVIDALGRLTDFYEDPDGIAYRTTYTYDLANNLVKVTQDTQQRFYMYDSLQRLIRFRNPEQGTYSNLNLTDSLTGNSAWSTGYQYDANGNMTQKTDARGVSSSYFYDALNRETAIDYSDTASINPDITHVYDGATNGKGKLWYSYAGGSENVGTTVEKTIFDSFDAIGRPLVIKQSFKTNSVWNSSPYQITRFYNPAGRVTTQIYPSGHLVTYNYDNAGRLADKDAQNLAFTGTLGDGAPRTYARGLLYAAAGHPTQEQFGTLMPVFNKRFYNLRQQLAEILASTTGGDTSWNRGKIINSYSLQCSGAACNATDNNGNLRKQQVFIPLNEQASSSTSWFQQYDYDALNRLKRVHEYTGNTPLDWQQEYLYDRWGNRRIDVDGSHTFGAGINNKNFDKDDATNRLYAPGELAPFPDANRRIRYDAAGNQIKDTYSGFGDATFDAENRITTIQDQFAGTSSYTYNADGKRVRRKINNQETWQIYGFAGELLAEYPFNGPTNNPTKEYGYRNGELLVTAEAGASFAPPVFADDFNDNSLNTNSWTAYGPGSPTVSEQSQQLQITLAPNTAGYNGVYSNSTYSLTGRMVQVESAQAVSQAGWCENFLEVELDANNYFMIQVGAGNMIFRSRVNGVNDQTSIAFDGTANRFWRIRHDQGTNRIFFETSANDSVWLTRKTVTPGFSLNALRFHLLAGAYGTGNSSPGAAKYDNFKLLASTAPTSLTVPNAGFETPVLGNGNFQYSPTGGSWSFAAGGGISAMNSGFTGVPSAAPEGVQIAFIQGNGTVSQSIAGFQANTNYVVTLSAIQRTNCCNSGGQDIGVYIDDVQIGSFHPSATGYVEYSTPIFTTSIGAHTLKFAGLNPLGGDHTAFFDNVRITGTPKPGFGVQWLLTDQLGTPRIAFDESGALASVKRHDYLPFGEELVSQGLRNSPGLGYASGDGVRQQFTSKERDNESGLDYFGARYYSSTQGRFTSIDPAMASGTLMNPQSWNRYSYVNNNPLAFVDENGKWATDIHNRIIDIAFAGMSGGNRDILKRVSRDMDGIGNQTQATSYLHGMRAPYQTAAQAAKQASDFIGSQRDKAREIQASFEKAGGIGISKEALAEFGKALHTVTDMTSPMHEGFQVWYGIPVPGDPKAGRDAYEAYKHNQGEGTISYERLGFAVGAAVQLFQHTFGDERAYQMTERAKLGTEDDEAVKQIHRELQSNPNKEDEAIYSYRIGLSRGYAFNWKF